MECARNSDSKTHVKSIIGPLEFKLKVAMGHFLGHPVVSRLPERREFIWLWICILKAAREEGLNEGIRAMFSAGLGGALMKVVFLPFLIS